MFIQHQNNSYPIRFAIFTEHKFLNFDEYTQNTLTNRKKKFSKKSILTVPHRQQSNHHKFPGASIFLVRQVDFSSYSQLVPGQSINP